MTQWIEINSEAAFSFFASLVFANYFLNSSKGQLISKSIFGVFKFFQKMNENKSTWGIIVVKSTSFAWFLEEVRIPKSPFEINWPLVLILNLRPMTTNSLFISIVVFVFTVQQKPFLLVWNVKRFPYTNVKNFWHLMWKTFFHWYVINSTQNKLQAST